MKNQILEECLRRIASGVSIEECLAAYPDLRDDLEPMLRAAARLQSARELTAPTAFKRNARTRLLNQITNSPIQEPNATSAAAVVRQWWRQLQRAWQRPRMLPTSVAALGVALVLILGVFATTAVAQSAMPGDALFPIKLWEEQLQVRFSSDPAQLQLTFAEQRLQESLTLQREQRYNDMEEALDYYRQQIEAWASLATMTPVSEQAQIQESLRRQMELLDTLEQTAPVQQQNVVRETQRQIEQLLHDPGLLPEAPHPITPTVTRAARTSPTPERGDATSTPSKAKQGPIPPEQTPSRKPSMTPPPQKAVTRTPRGHNPPSTPTPPPDNTPLPTPVQEETRTPAQMTPPPSGETPTHGGGAGGAQPPHTPQPTQEAGKSKGRRK